MKHGISPGLLIDLSLAAGGPIVSAGLSWLASPVMPKAYRSVDYSDCRFGVLALIAKWYFTVDSFYKYGHYRADSVPEIAAQEPVFQTPRYCQTCHSERHAQWSAGSHKSVICEVCHGAAQGHPQNGKLPIPKDTAEALLALP